MDTSRKVEKDSADVKQAAESVKDTTMHSGREMLAQLDDLRGQIEELAMSLGEEGGNRLQSAARRVKRSARGMAREGMDRAEYGMHAAADKAEDLYSDAERFVAEKPTMALGIAAGLGLLAGLMLSRR